MREVTDSALIKHPPERVFDAAAEAEKMLEWDGGYTKSIERLTSGPIQQGTRYRGRFKGFGTVEWEFSEYDRPRGFQHHSKMPFGNMFHTFAFEPVPEGTRLTQTMELKPNIFGKIMWPVMRPRLAKREPLVAQELGNYLDRTSGAA